LPLLNKQNAFPARLLFVSSRESASIFEIANKEIARIDMEDGVLASANQGASGTSFTFTDLKL